MVLEPKQTTVAYRCPRCGAGVMSVVGLFNISADMVKLKCDCGGSEMIVRRMKDGKINFTVPCILCPEPHRFTLSSNNFFTKDIFFLSWLSYGINFGIPSSTLDLYVFRLTAGVELDVNIAHVIFIIVSIVAYTKISPKL